jgi:hypothetical protein
MMLLSPRHQMESVVPRNLSCHSLLEVNRLEGNLDVQNRSLMFVYALPQGGTESIYANINSAYDLDKKQNNILRRPFRIEVEKSEVIANYRVFYRGVRI